MEQETITVPVRVTKKDETPTFQHGIEEGIETFGAGAVGAEREGMLATHELELAPKLQDVFRALSEYRRAYLSDLAHVALPSDLLYAGGDCLADLLGVACLGEIDDYALQKRLLFLRPKSTAFCRMCFGRCDAILSITDRTSTCLREQVLCSGATLACLFEEARCKLS